jgi:hypothetical protein
VKPRKAPSRTTCPLDMGNAPRDFHAATPPLPICSLRKSRTATGTDGSHTGYSTRMAWEMEISCDAGLFAQCTSACTSRTPCLAFHMRIPKYTTRTPRSSAFCRERKSMECRLILGPSLPGEERILYCTHMSLSGHFRLLF